MSFSSNSPEHACILDSIWSISCNEIQSASSSYSFSGLQGSPAAFVRLRDASSIALKVFGPSSCRLVDSYAGPFSSGVCAPSIMVIAAPISAGAPSVIAPPVSISFTPSITPSSSGSPTGALDPASAARFLTPGMWDSLYGWKYPIFLANSTSLWFSSSERSLFPLRTPMRGWWSTARCRSGWPTMKYLNLESAQYRAHISPSMGAYLPSASLQNLESISTSFQPPVQQSSLRFPLSSASQSQYFWNIDVPMPSFDQSVVTMVVLSTSNVLIPCSASRIRCPFACSNAAASSLLHMNSSPGFIFKISLNGCNFSALIRNGAVCSARPIKLLIAFCDVGLGNSLSDFSIFGDTNSPPGDITKPTYSISFWANWNFFGLNDIPAFPICVRYLPTIM